MILRRLVLLLVVIFVCLLTGIQAGRLLKNADDNLKSNTKATEPANYNIEENATQRTSVLPVQTKIPLTEIRLLIILIDDFSHVNIDERSPQLRSMWLMVYNPAMPRLFWIAVYPQVDPKKINTNQLLETRLKIEKNLTLSDEYLNVLHDQMKLNWDGLLIVDDYKLAQLIDTLGGITIENNPINGRQALQTLNIQTEDYQLALIAHSRVIQAICQRRDQLTENSVVITPLVDWLINQLQVDTSSSEMKTQLTYLFTQPDALFCQFGDNL